MILRTWKFCINLRIEWKKMSTVQSNYGNNTTMYSTRKNVFETDLSSAPTRAKNCMLQGK